MKLSSSNMAQSKAQGGRPDRFRCQALIGREQKEIVRRLASLTREIGLWWFFPSLPAEIIEPHSRGRCSCIGPLWTFESLLQNFIGEFSPPKKDLPTRYFGTQES
jgi:hypothetical protein